MLLLMGMSGLQAQFNGPGPILSVGIGLGVSSHAGSYEVDEIIRIRQYPGFRAFNIEAKMGWALSSRLQTYAVGRISPANSTVSPYQSTYTGGAIAMNFSEDLPFFVFAGAGYYRAKVDRGLRVGHGTLYNVGFGKQFSTHFYMDINAHFGKMKPGDISPDPFDDQELNFSVMLDYSFF